MRFLVLLAVLAGCKSAPVQYEIIEVHGEKLSNMRRLVQREKQDMLLEVHGRNASQQRPGRGLFGSCRAIPGQTGPLPTESRIDVGGVSTAEQRAPARNQTADEGIGLSAGD